MRDSISQTSTLSAGHEWNRIRPFDVDVHSRVWGDAGRSLSSVPIVLVAGLGVSSRYWVRLGRRLGEMFYVVAPDLPGFGRTRKSPAARWPAGPSVRQQADQLLAWMDARSMKRAVLCGHSVGCQTAVDLATRFPDRVERLIIAAPTYERGHRTLASHLPRLAVGAFVEAPSLTPLLVYEYMTAGLARVLQQAHRTMQDPLELKLPSVAAPTLVIRGTLDPLVRQTWTQTVAGLVPGATLVEIERVGHAVQYSSAAVMGEIVTQFLQGRLKAGTSVVVPEDDPVHDPLGPPQPISPALHRSLDVLTGIVAMVLPRALKWGPRAQRALVTVALTSIANNLITDRGRKARGIPMISHANVDFITGTCLLVAAARTLRGQPRSARLATALFGAYQIAAAALTAKPTGPASTQRAEEKTKMEDGRWRME